MNYIELLPVEKPREQIEDAVNFKWDDYHQDVLAVADDLDDDDDFDEDDYDVEVIYKR
jgi:GTPase